MQITLNCCFYFKNPNEALICQKVYLIPLLLFFVAIKITTAIVHKHEKSDGKGNTSSIKHKGSDEGRRVPTTKNKYKGIDGEGSGSGSGGSGYDYEHGSGHSGESGSGFVAVTPKVLNVTKVLLKKNDTKLPHSMVKKSPKAKVNLVTVQKNRRNKIPDKKHLVSHFEFGEFKLPVKKSIIPVSSLAFADKNGDELESGSGDSPVEAHTVKNKVSLNTTVQSPKPVSAKNNNFKLANAPISAKTKNKKGLGKKQSVSSKNQKHDEKKTKEKKKKVQVKSSGKIFSHNIFI